MSSNSQNNPDNQEIDLSQVSRKLGQAYENFLSWIFRGFLFVKRNIITFVVLFIIGAGLGFYLDRTTTVYNHEIIIAPNFGSTEYAYSKVNLINSKIKENDVRFLKSIGITEPKLISEIEIEPITDIYNFVNGREQNFEMIKLMAEDGDINKIIADETTSINYTNHRLKITTTKTINEKQIIDPILKYLNESNYFTDLQKSVQESTRLKIKANERTIAQIDSLLSNFSSMSKGNGKSDKLVYYNENTQLNDILQTKNELILDLANRKIELINISDIIKDNSIVLNVKNNKSLNGKMKFVIPFIFISIFLGLGILRAFYRNQMLKLKDR
ncbi:hypothetical protein CLV94_1448 [Flavobacterium endophyticum]|uniref:Subunit length determinant protein n=1 Tax=Flavobacterium endophyticum TaxID=1540163 RepID=A0A495MM18_9FLAO|nr:hypothetical protein [Flavobacterium endophyticum]RKS26390.1 hypothetical protein CLV94_1448 [Flavobacterium endophyticum]